MILPTRQTAVLCQGITTSAGAMHTELAVAYGTNIVAGTSRDEGVKSFLNIPVFKTVKEAVLKTSPTVSVIFSSPARALLDVEEAARARIPLVICTTEHVPVHDVLKMQELAEKYHITLIGPSSLGIVRAGDFLAGAIPAHLFPKGHVGIVGRSSSLIYEAVQQLSGCGEGVSVCVSLGASELIATSFVPVVKELMSDAETKAVLVIGQLHGSLEFELAQAYRKMRRKKPMAVYIAGGRLRRFPKIPVLGTNMSDPAQIVQEKQEVLRAARIHVIETPERMGHFLKGLL